MTKLEELPARARDLLASIGDTPLVELGPLLDVDLAGARLFAKLETANPGGSLKDRPVSRMLLRALQAGISRDRRTIRSALGGVSQYEHSTILVRSDLSLERRDKPPPDFPENFAEYSALLESTCSQSLDNATDPRRAKRYSPLISLSRGYDSTALAATIARHVRKWWQYKRLAWDRPSIDG